MAMAMAIMLTNTKPKINKLRPFKHPLQIVGDEVIVLLGWAFDSKKINCLFKVHKNLCYM